jgi:hypothetical protein
MLPAGAVFDAIPEGQHATGMVALLGFDVLLYRFSRDMPSRPK